MTKKQVRRLLAAGASVRAVMLDADVRQRQVADACGWPQSRVAAVLAGDAGSTPAGRETALRVFEAVAELLGVAVREIPAARKLTHKEGGMMEGTHTEPTTDVTRGMKAADDRVEFSELVEEFDLPELADTMEEADARAAASTFLFALRNVQRDLDANDAEFTVLQDFNRARHVRRQGGLISQIEYLRGVVKTLFRFMRPSGKKKSLSLIGGRVGMRAQTDELVVEDDEAVVAWVQANQVTTAEPLVKVKLVLDRTALRAYMESRAEEPDLPAPPGVKLEARPDKFYATPAKD